MSDNDYLYRMMKPEDDFYMGDEEDEDTNDETDVVSFCVADHEDTCRKLDYVIECLEKELAELEAAQKKESPKSKK